MKNKHLLILPLLLIAFCLKAQNFTMRQVVCGLQMPWEITYGPDNFIWATEARGYKVSRINPQTGVSTVLLDLSNNKNFANYPSVSPQGGLMGLALHPNLLSGKPYVYLAYVFRYDGGSAPTGQFFKTKVVRYTYNSTAQTLTNEEVICDTIPGSNDHNGGRTTIGQVNGQPFLFYSVGDMGAGQFDNKDRANHAQNAAFYEGKIMRFNVEPDADANAMDKWIPNNNPFNAARQSAVWSIGHRNGQGLVFANGKLYEAEHGPYSDDEINIIESGANYGHPLVCGINDGNYNGIAVAEGSGVPIIMSEQNNALSLGAAYRNPMKSFFPAPLSTNTTAYNNTKNNTPPFANYYLSWQTIAPSGVDYYNSTAIPNWQNSILITSLKRRRIYRLQLNAAGTAITSDTIPLFADMGRFRDLAISADGTKIYVSCDSEGQTSGPTAGTTIDPPNKGCILEFTYTPDQTGVNCTSKSSAPWNEWISNVTFSNINNTSNKTRADRYVIGYSDWTDKIATVSKGQSYPLSITPSLGYIGNLPQEYCRVWIDWNANGIFEDSEKVLESTNANPFTTNVLVPPIAIVGASKMRVSLKNGSYPTACESFANGEVEDYTVNIQATSNSCITTNCPANITVNTTTNSAVASWATPTLSGTCGGFVLQASVPPSLTVVNSGASFPVGVSNIRYDVFNTSDGSLKDSSCRFSVTVVQTMNNSCRYQDSLQLVSLYNATNGANWNLAAANKWNLTKPIDTWYGITLNASGCVLTIDLNGVNQSAAGSIPPNLNFSALERLSFALNRLTGSIPNFNLPQLKELYLEENQLSGAIPNFNLPNLRQITLFTNQLTGTIPNFNFPNLTNLNFDNNQLSGAIPSFSFTGLRYLHLTNNQLTGCLPTSLKSICPTYLEVALMGNAGLATQDFNAFCLNNTGACGATPPQYCAAKSTLPWEYWVGNVNFGTINNSSDKFKDFATLGYSDYTNLSTTLNKGQSYPLSITPGLSWIGNVPNVYCRVWIDFNNNKTFEANELVLEKTNANPLTQSVLIPTTAVTGVVRMRVALKFGAYPTACETFDKGEVEDYLVTIQGGTTPNLPDLSGYYRIGGYTIDRFLSFNETAIGNAGTAASTPTTMKVYISRDSVYPSGLLYGEFPIPAIGAGLSYQTSGSASLLDTFQTGVKYYTITVIDPLNTVVESNENNNVFISNGSIYKVVVSNSCRTQDSLQLVSLYNATNGANWRIKWNLNTPINTWNGITLNANGCVSEIHLGSNQLSGTVPPNLNMQNLLALDLYGGTIGGTIPNFNLPNLQIIELGGNRLTGTIPNFNLPNLKTLYLYGNLLTGSIPNFNLPNLTALALFSNQLTGTIPNFNAVGITFIDLHANQLTGSIPAFSLPNLFQLNLSSNNLSGCIPLSLKSLCPTAANYVNISNNPNLATQDINAFCSNNNTGACTGGSADIGLSVAATPSVYKQYTPTTFRITAQNSGSIAASNINIEFKFPLNTTNGGTAIPSIGSWNQWCAGGVQCFTWTIPSLGVNSSATLDVPVYVLNATGSMLATAKLLSSTPMDNNISNNTATIIVNQATAPLAQAQSQATQLIPIVIQRIAPNPSDGEVIVELESLDARTVQFDFSNAMGSRIHSEKRAVEKGLNRVLFDVSALPQGVYFVAPNTNRGHKVPTKFVKL